MRLKIFGDVVDAVVDPIFPWGAHEIKHFLTRVHPPLNQPLCCSLCNIFSFFLLTILHLITGVYWTLVLFKSAVFL